MSKHILAPIAALAAGALFSATAAAQGSAPDTTRPDTARPDTTKPDTTKPDTTPRGDVAPKGESGAQEPTKEAPKPGTLTAPDAKGDQGATAQGRIDRPVHVDQLLSLPVENGCTYNAHVKGTVAPMRAAAGATASSTEPRVSSDLTISATVQCPNATDLKVSERSARVDVSRGEMLDALALRGTIASSASGQRCLYLPDLDLNADGKMTLDGVAFVCPAMRGHGTGTAPSDTTGTTPPKR